MTFANYSLNGYFLRITATKVSKTTTFKPNHRILIKQLKVPTTKMVGM